MFVFCSGSCMVHLLFLSIIIFQDAGYDLQAPIDHLRAIITVSLVRMGHCLPQNQFLPVCPRLPRREKGRSLSHLSCPSCCQPAQRGETGPTGFLSAVVQLAVVSALRWFWATNVNESDQVGLMETRERGVSETIDNRFAKGCFVSISKDLKS